ncbi:MAG: cytochrome c biogenesis protein CcsA [Bdellovibrionaceae bacterium]|nr:cytochrome c biogenesis protein CcsA [Bdellovibrionales bacterium]MCB9082917.1 cytochrome c biogenesis protein CcsA [Pseudobdellovibrionaceae bacterium]
MFMAPSAWAGAAGEALRTLPVQQGGRIKPYDSFAREALKLVYGREKYQKREAADVVLTWMIIPEHWDEVEFIQVRHSGLREALKLDGVRVYYSPKELFLNERVGLLVQEMRTKLQAQEKLNPYYQAVQTLENQLSLYHGIKFGQALQVVPDASSETWLPVARLEGELKDKFAAITKAFIKVVTTESEGKGGADEAVANLEAAVADFKMLAQSVSPEKYGNQSKIKAEVHLNTFHPFMWSWIFYLIGGLFLLGAMVNNRKWLYVSGWVTVIVGFLLHTYGMGVRSYLLGRPPVSNMYETVVWVPWGAIIFAALLEWKSRSKTVLMVSSLLSVFCLILTDMAPSVLDKTLSPLQPVLRDNFWLTTHVLVITLSYAAFFLAFALADLQLVYFLRDEGKYAQKIQEGTKAIYRTIQVGVILLGAGIILGGVWADYSWGRFWGWDPKETWALIAWFGYLAILHGRIVGWVRQFGLAVSSIIGFSLVIMAWYGVNFVLGAGLHSYGFGAGGVEYVSAFVAAHILWVVYVATVRQSRLKSRESSAQ